MYKKPALMAALFAILAPSCFLIPNRGKVQVLPVETVTAGGVENVDLLPGHGEPVSAGQEVTIDYIARLEDGTEVDSTYSRGLPLTFVIGSAPLDGLNDAIAGMRPGGKRRSTVPPALAYGAAGVPGFIPADALLIFDCELVSPVMEDVTIP